MQARYLVWIVIAILILTVLLPLVTHGQTGSLIQQRGRQIAKDLLRLDQCEATLLELKEEMTDKDQAIETYQEYIHKQVLIIRKQGQVIFNDSIIHGKDSLLLQSADRKIKKERRVKNILLGAVVVLVVKQSYDWIDDRLKR